MAGWVAGRAAVLVIMSDLCVAADTTRFRYPEPRIGLTAGGIAALAARIPYKVAMEFMPVGEPMGARRAYEAGLVNAVLPPGDHLHLIAARTLAGRLAANAPLVLRTLKRFLAETLPTSPAERPGFARRWLDPANESRDFAEGGAAFRDKRPPRFERR